MTLFSWRFVLVFQQNGEDTQRRRYARFGLSEALKKFELLHSVMPFSLGDDCKRFRKSFLTWIQNNAVEAESIIGKNVN